MNMKHTFVMAWCLLLASGLWTACSEDTQSLLPPAEPEEEQPILGEGQFLVSYGTTASAARALSDGPLPTAQRISSLHYFVYDSATDNLVKKRQIRGINENTHWPIGDRDKMSWELRQDLQDTLMAGPTYRILFIANVDPALFVKADGTAHPEIVRHVEKYTSAQILLPEVPFSDHNMYYLWEGSLKADAGTTVRRKDVKLQRLVTRMDVTRKVLPEVDEYLKELIAKDLFVDETIRTQLNNHIDGICKEMPEKMQGDYNGNAVKMANYLKKPEVRDTLFKAFKEKIYKEYTEVLMAEGGDFQKKLQDWNLAQSVKISYAPKSRCSALFFSRTKNETENLTQDEAEILPLEHDAFSVVGFWGHTQDLNEITSIDFVNGEHSIFSLNAATLSTGKDMNRWFKVECNPIASISVNNGAMSIDHKLSFVDALKSNPEFKKLLYYDLGLFDYNFKHWVEKNVFNQCKKEDGTLIYGTGFESFTFTNISLPKLEGRPINELVTLHPSWKVTRVEY